MCRNDTDVLLQETSCRCGDESKTQRMKDELQRVFPHAVTFVPVNKLLLPYCTK